MTSNSSLAASAQPPDGTSFLEMPLVWDSTTLNKLMSCPRRFYLASLLGYRPRTTDDRLSFGIIVHKAIEDHLCRLARGDDDARATRETLREALQTGHDAKLPAEGAISLEALGRIIVWYFDHFRHDALKLHILPSGTPAVELSFQFPIPLEAPSGEYYCLSGHLDMVGDFSGTLYVVDHKTTTSTLGANYFSSYSPNLQVSLYSFAAEVILGTPVSGVLINAIQTGVTFCRFSRHFATRTPEQKQEFYESLIFWLRFAEGLIAANSFPMNETSCRWCEFKPVCSKPPAVQKLFLDSDFEVRPWNPGKPRTPGSCEVR